MSWQLHKSRGLFFARTGEPRRSYWASEAIVTMVRSQGSKVPRDLFEWDPSTPDSRSNCPLLHEMLIELISLADPRWRDRAESIYAGRTWSNDDTAFTDQNMRSGMVALSDQFTSVLIAYSAMYGVFLNSIDDARNRPTEDAKIIQRGMRAEFDHMVDAFKVGGLLALKGKPFMTMPSLAHWGAADLYTRAAEQWTLAHELSHHLARDLSTRRDKGVEALMAQFKSRSALGPKLAALSGAQRCEVEADLLATLLLAGHFLPGGATSRRCSSQSAALPSRSSPSVICATSASAVPTTHIQAAWSASGMS
jgi:hypothetical protein